MYLLIGDLHLTDRQRDAYRFDIFPLVKKLQRKHKPKNTIFLGDICDKKDKHSSYLTNKIIECFSTLEAPVTVQMGNHDYIEPSNPFFKFINNISSIDFVITPKVVADNVLVLPHIRSEEAFYEALKPFSQKRLELVLIHQTVDGAVAETGARLKGLKTAPIAALQPRFGIWAGDIHKPQQIGPVTYVGAPYTIRFGDNFEPRLILIDDAGEAHNIYTNFPRKWSLTIRDHSELKTIKDLYSGDQVKITVELLREEVIEWKQVKAKVLDVCKRLELDVFGIDLKINNPKTRKETDTNNKRATDTDFFTAYCKKENIPLFIREYGHDILKGGKTNV